MAQQRYKVYGSVHTYYYTSIVMDAVRDRRYITRIIIRRHKNAAIVEVHFREVDC